MRSTVPGMLSLRRPAFAAVATAAAAVLTATLAAPLVAPAAASTVAAEAVAADRSAGPSWRLLPTGSNTHFRGLAAVSRSVAWLGGYDGVILRTTDGGHTWDNVSPAGAGALQFRDIEAFDARHAVAMAAGEGSDSRLYVTRDGGASWRLAYTNHSASAFYDCMAFFDSRHGLTLSDPVNGRFRILVTADGGSTWRVRVGARMPAAVDGEFAFAASGSCLTTAGRHDAWFGTGGAAARVFHSTDGGRTWSVSTPPIRHTESGGIFSLAFRDRLHGLAIGGDFVKPYRAPHALALTSDGGRTWTPVPTSAAPDGYRSGSDWVPGSRTAVAVGFSGSDRSTDGGHHWVRIGHGQFDSVECTADGACWASGDEGRVAKLRR